MVAILSYFKYIFLVLVKILNFRPFADFPLTYIELICSFVIIKFILKFLFGGFKEIETSFNYINSRYTSSQISNSRRKMQISKKNKEETLKQAEMNRLAGNVKVNKASKSEIAEISRMIDNSSSKQF